ncbi:MAG: hypothetical protein ACOC7U_04935 [Spirochaetota bacterium]
MKKTSVVVFVLVLMVMGFLGIMPAPAISSITGAYGYLTVPGTNVPRKGEITINSGYIFSPGNFYLSVNTSIVERWELWAGKELPVGEGTSMASTPYIMGTKVMFYGSRRGGFRAAVGLQLELLGREYSVDGPPVTLFGMISENAGKLGYISTGMGYTLGVDAGYRINFFLGLRKALIGEQLFAVGEFTNFSLRQGLELGWNEHRGIFNAGLALRLTDFMEFKFYTLDLFDRFLTVGLGGTFKIKAF